MYRIITAYCAVIMMDIRRSGNGDRRGRCGDYSPISGIVADSSGRGLQTLSERRRPR